MSVQVMDTASLPCEANTALHYMTSVKSSTKSNVIHDYKLLVKGMVGLMLRLSNEGASSALMQDLHSAASSLVRPLHYPLSMTTYVCHWQCDNSTSSLLQVACQYGS